MINRVCDLFKFYFTNAEALSSEELPPSSKGVASMLASVASFFACLRSFPSTLWGRATRNPCQAALAVGVVALSAFSYRAWRADVPNEAFHQALDDWVKECSNDLNRKEELEKRKEVRKKIKECQKTFAETLNLQRCDLTSLPPICVFEALPYLKTLDLSHNELNTVPNELGEFLPKLKELNLSCNSLTTLPKSFASLKSSAFKEDCHLNLSNNSFTEFPKISEVPNLLITFSLDDSKFTEWLYPQNSALSRPLDQLYLTGNCKDVEKKSKAYCMFIRENLIPSNFPEPNQKKAACKVLELLKKSACSTLDLEDISKEDFPRHHTRCLKDAGIVILNK